MLFGSSVSRSTSYKACSLTVVSKPASQYIKLILLGSHVLSFAALRRFLHVCSKPWYSQRSVARPFASKQWEFWPLSSGRPAEGEYRVSLVL